jgi:hypothetical protein
MAFDNSTRNKLHSLVNSARRLLATEFLQQLQTTFAIFPDGSCADIDSMKSISSDDKEVAILLRERLAHLLAGMDDRIMAVERMVREMAFTVLNRFIALRMAEERGIIRFAVSKGFLSDGFRVYEQIAGSNLGSQYDRYKVFIFSLFDELSLDLGILFDRYSTLGVLFPRERALLDLFELINDKNLAGIYTEDETIGWVYQYFNDEAERKKMREESNAPRNSRELAVRNQFFTPRYVVEFLTDNTLAKTWYEMTDGKTNVVDGLTYFVKNTPSETSIPIKDPREIKMLDPACGSMHFGLYAYDIFEKIYIDAWQSYPDLLKDIREKCNHSLDEFMKQIPVLILRHNIHGIDIDPRAVQIAGLSLWLRAQKSFQRLKLKQSDRPQIRKVNVVTAEPMPGELEFLDEFCKELKPNILGSMVKDIFEYMKLAGEAGSLLKIEEEIQNVVKKYKKSYIEYKDAKKDSETKGALFPDMIPGVMQKNLFDYKDITDEGFWLSAEKEILKALEEYSVSTQEHRYQKKLFAEDTARGFAFIELLRNKYDVVVMNPPFGAASTVGKETLGKQYPLSKNDLLAVFVERGLILLHTGGRNGAITSRTGFFLTSYQKWRENIVLKVGTPKLLADLGYGVMDNAMVEAAAYIIRKN